MKIANIGEWRGMAFMFPMLEMAGDKQAISDVIYYCRDNIGTNDHTK